jgi:hypothetical protein
MSDTGNVFVVNHQGILGSKEGVVLYTHSEGQELALVVKKVLSKRVRWDDAAYLGRIIFCQMIKGKEEEDFGFGITNEVFDAKRPIILIDVENQEISFCYPNTFDECLVEESVFVKWKFEEYTKTVDLSIQSKWESI